MARKPAKQITPKAEVIPPAPAMTEDLFEEILDRIANGSSLLRLEKEDNFPARSTMWKFINATEDRRAAYDQARQDRADYRVEMMDAVIAQVHAGKLDPQSGRVMIDAMKWQAEKENSRRYGNTNRVDLTVSQGPLGDVPDEELDRRLVQLMERHDFVRLTADEEG